jgi:hypothetical protein
VPFADGDAVKGVVSSAEDKRVVPCVLDFGRKTQRKLAPGCRRPPKAGGPDNLNMFSSCLNHSL